jgi:putative ABC transport system ATP-binding protein
VHNNVAIAGMAERVIRISSGEIVEVTSNEHRISPAELSW